MRLHMGKERICVGVGGGGGGGGVLAQSAMTVISGQMAHGSYANTVRESARRVNSLSLSLKKKKKKKKIHSRESNQRQHCAWIFNG